MLSTKLYYIVIFNILVYIIMENIDKIVEDTGDDTTEDNGVVEQEQPKPIEKAKRPRTAKQIEAWEKCLAKRKAMCKTIKEAKNNEKERIRKAKDEAVEKLLKKEEEEEPNVEDQLEQDSEEDEEEDEPSPPPKVVVKKKNKKIEKPKKKRKTKVVYVSESEDDDPEDEDYTEEDEGTDEEEVERPRRQIKKTKNTKPKDTTPKDAYEGMDFRTKMRMRGF